MELGRPGLEANGAAHFDPPSFILLLLSHTSSFHCRDQGSNSGRSSKSSGIDDGDDDATGDDAVEEPERHGNVRKDTGDVACRNVDGEGGGDMDCDDVVDDVADDVDVVDDVADDPDKSSSSFRSVWARSYDRMWESVLVGGPMCGAMAPPRTTFASPNLSCFIRHMPKLHSLLLSGSSNKAFL